MVERIFRVLNILFVIVALSSCATAQQKQSDGKRFQGHWTTGVAYSYFTLLDGSKSYWVFDKDMPPEAVKFIESQPSRRDPFGNVGECQAIYLDVLGTIEEYKSSTPGITSHLHVNRILKMEPARPEFFKSSKHPLP